MQGDGDRENRSQLKGRAGLFRLLTIAIVTAIVVSTVGPAGAQNMPERKEVTVAISCLAGNGRVDLNVVNLGDSAADYRIEFAGLTDRQNTVAPGDWWRQPVTGRADGTYTVTIKRNSQVVHREIVRVGCDVPNPSLPSPEVQIVNACRAGNGYLIFQFVNDSEQPKPYVIRFGAIPNRSTTAAANGQSVRAVTGRPDRVHAYEIVSGAEVVEAGVVEVDCDPDPPGYASGQLAGKAR